MTFIYASAVVPINFRNTSTSNIITPAEFWSVLEYKCRNPAPFVKSITSSRVVKEDRDQSGQITGLTRLVTVDESFGTAEEIEEVAVIKRPVMVTFNIPSTGTVITNILAHGPNPIENPEDIYMVSTYEWNHPEVEFGSNEFKALQAKYSLLSSQVASHTVAMARQMKIEGKLTDLAQEYLITGRKESSH